jgi:drug/metabolite transporter (DMT)-like permease
MTTARALDDRIVPAAGGAARAPGDSTGHAGRAGGTGRAGAGVGVAVGLLSAMCFGTSGTFGSSLIAAGWSPAGAVLARVCVAALALTVPALVALRGRWSLLRTAAWRMTAYGLVGVAACQVCYFNAIAHMDVGISILLEYMGIILVVGWLWLRHGQRPRPLTVLGGLAALGGLALMLDLSGSGSGGVTVTGVLWALGAAVAMAVYFFQSATANSGGRADSASGNADDLPPVVLTWGGMVTGAAAIAMAGAAHLAPLRYSAADVTLQDHRGSWLIPVLGLGVVAAAIAYVTGVAAVRRLGAKLGSFVAMAEVLFAAGFAWILLHQVPTTTQFLGGALILAGVVAVRLDEN